MAFSTVVSSAWVRVTIESLCRSSDKYLVGTLEMICSELRSIVTNFAPTFDPTSHILVRPLDVASGCLMNL